MIPREAHEQNLRVLLAPIASLIDDRNVSEIMINGPDRVYAEREGQLYLTEHHFDDAQALLAAVRAVAQYAGRNIGPEAPVLEARLPDGSRLEAVVPPAAPLGPIVSIRRFTHSGLTLDQLVQHGSLRAAGAEILRAIVEGRRNVLVSGGTGSGKTSLLNALARFIANTERVIVIEDARELQLPHEHVVQLEARPADVRGRGEVSVRQLFKATLRLRPDRIVLGEIRGGEALELIQAMTSGHAGCLATIHATSPADALARLETMSLMSDVELPLWALRGQIASAIDVIVQTTRIADGARVVSEITEVAKSGNGYALHSCYHAGHARTATTSPENLERERSSSCSLVSDV
jgi:pilus assembly protein CpaF